MIDRSQPRRSPPVTMCVLRLLPLWLAAWTTGIFAPTHAADRPAASVGITLTEPLPVLLQRGATAFAAGDFPTAATAFAQIERDFGKEPEWRSGTLPRRLLPLRGFAQLRAGEPGDAAGSLAQFLDRFPDDAGQRGFVLYALALALHQSGKPDEALARFESFEKEHAGSAQAALARFQRAEIHFTRNRPDAALALLATLANDPATAESVRVQARLRALQKASELRRDAEAATLLLDEPWSVTSMPEIAVLAFAAMEIGDRLLASNQSVEALRAYRLVLPKKRLVDAQRVRLAELETLFAERAPTASTGSGAFWVDFYHARITRIRSQLAALETSEDYTAPLQLRVGQAFLLAGRHREAWLTFERLALNPATPDALRSEAHYRWILTAAELQSWDEALAIARAFSARFPDSTQAPEALHLIARAHLEQRRMAEAETVLSDLLARYPTHASAERARFTRGWVRTMREDFNAARADFDACLADHAKGPLATNAALWRALTHFFERNYRDALLAFEALEKSTPQGHPLLPEIQYRHATTLYAMRAFADAKDAMERFVAAHPHHPRHPEALVLLGDILMGMGQLDAARARFAEVTPDAIESFIYGVFQTGKILRAQEDHAGMVEFFTAYATRTDLPAQLRISEALYWIAWAEEQRGRADAALPVYLDVLARFGDDPSAAEVGTTLASLERLVRRIRSHGLSGRHATAPILLGTFDAWLADERTRAQRERRFTLWTRLTLAVADLHRARKEPFQAEALELEIAGTAPLVALDAPALARVGLALLAVESPSASDYFEKLVHTHPSSIERAAGFYGLASIAAKERRTREATRWLARFEAETPTHPLAPQAALLTATSLEQERDFATAKERYEDLLRLKSGRGRPHAEALMGLARCSIGEGDAKRAVAYLQRVYTLYRAQTDLAADAYLRSGALFESLGDADAAAATLREMLGTRDIGDGAQRESARRALAALEPRLTPTPPATPNPEPTPPA